MTIERVFNENSNFDIINLINDLITENIDLYLEKYYNLKVENFATSHCKKGDI